MRIRKDKKDKKYKKDNLTFSELMMCIVVYALITAFLAWLFYDSIAAIPFFWLVFPAFKKTALKIKEKKYDEELTEGFMKALVSVSTSMSAGISAQNAFMAAASDMEKLYGEDAAIVKELHVINSCVRSGKNLSAALFDFAKRSRIAEIYDFAVVYSVAKEKGGDFPAVISTCTDIMENRLRAEQEAKILIRSKQYEQRVMCVIVPGILLYLRLSGGNFINVLYHSPMGVMIMTLCLFVYVLAIVLSEKIGDVSV